ncbi:MAG: hypothetical protein ACR2FN_05720 [Chitinophagaceae bacterium]
MKKTFLLFVLASLFTATTFIANAQSWSLTGNAGTSLSTNFLGTTDNKTLAFRTHDIEQMRITYGGNVGIGIKTPIAKLQVIGNSYVNLFSPGYFVLSDMSAFNLGFDVNKIQSRYSRKMII